MFLKENKWALTLLWLFISFIWIWPFLLNFPNDNQPWETFTANICWSLFAVALVSCGILHNFLYWLTAASTRARAGCLIFLLWLCIVVSSAAALAGILWSSFRQFRAPAFNLQRYEFLPPSFQIAVSYRRYQHSHSQGWKSVKWWSTCHVSRWKIFMALRITGVCALPGATWEPPRAARQPSESPVSDLWPLIDLVRLRVHAKVHFMFVFFLPLRPEEELWARPSRHRDAAEWHDCAALPSPRGSACGWGEGSPHTRQVAFSGALPGAEQPHVCSAPCCSVSVHTSALRFPV